MTMQKEVRDRWTAALRSGEYEQGQGQLRTDDGRFCCLGVLCDVVGLDLTEKPTERYNWHRSWGEMGGVTFFPPILGDLVDRDIREDLSTLNDAGETFAQIADYIEQNVPAS